MKPTKNRYFCVDAQRIKMLFESESAAKNFIKFNTGSIIAHGGHAPKRVYYCMACGGWHVTSKESVPQHRSRVERYFDRKREAQTYNKSCEELKQDLIQVVVKYLTSDDIDYKDHQAREFFDIKRQFQQLSKTEGERGLYKHVVPVIEKLECLFIGSRYDYEEVLNEINPGHSSYSVMGYIRNRIRDGLKKRNGTKEEIR